jgi:glutathione S-transferase
MTVAPYQLIAAEVSLYSGKARAYLRHKRVPFEELFASRQVIAKIVRPKTGLTMIPVLLTPAGAAIQDTTAIIDYIEAQHPQRSVYPSTPLLRLASLLLELYGDEWLVMPAMHYRWHYKRENMRLILSAFGQIVAPGLPAILHPLAGLPLAAYFGGNYGRALGINHHNRDAIERSYEAFLRDFDAHLGEHPFLLGARPSVGDFGFMGPLYAHLYRDPAPGKLMRRIAPRVAEWVERMNTLHFIDDEVLGSFGVNDEPPHRLDPIFRRLFAEHWPVVADTIVGVDRWVRAHPDKSRISRFVGEHEFTIEGATTTRWIQSFTQWMAQRPLDAYHALAPDDRARADRWLARVGGARALGSQPPTRVERVHNRLAPVVNP